MKGKEGYLIDERTGNAQFPVTSFNCVKDPQRGITLTEWSDGVEDDLESHGETLGQLANNTDGKTIVVFGDSIIQRDLWYPTRFRATGIPFKNFYVYGCGAASLANDSGTINGYDESRDFGGAIWNQVQKFWHEYTEGNLEQPDVFLIDGGANDGNSPIGNVETVFDYSNKVMDFTTKQLHEDFNAGDSVWWSVMGGIRCMVSFLQVKFPDALIILATPLPRVFRYDSENTMTAVSGMRSVADAIIVAGKWLGVDVIDKWEGCGLNPDWDYQSSYYLSDGVHPNSVGGTAIAKFMAARIRELVRWRL